MSDKYKPLVPIDDHISIEGLGFGKGSEIGVIINPNRAWRRDWYNHFDIQLRPRDMLPEDDTRAASDAREDAMLARQYELCAHVLLSAKIYDKHGTVVLDKSNLTVADIRHMDEEIDPRILELVMLEMIERGNGGVVNTRTTFRNERESGARRGKENQNTATVAGD